MTIVLGIDLGSALAKGILLQNRKILGSYICPSGGHFANTAQQVKNELLARSGFTPSDPVYTVATGYGSKAVSFANEIVTDITCHGRGLHFLFPEVGTIVDVGDLYSKAIRIDNQGHILSFLLSGKCAGGSGRILKVMAKVLQVPVEELGALSLKSQKRLISTRVARFLPNPRPFPALPRGLPRKTCWLPFTALWLPRFIAWLKGSVLSKTMP